MRQLRLLSTFEGTLIALVPAVAVLIAYLYQVGSYFYLGVPFELVELSTPKIIVSIIATVFFFWFYGVVWAENFSGPQPKKWYELVAWHLFINIIMTAVFWFRPRGDLFSNLATLFFCLVFFTAGTLWLQKLIRPPGTEKPTLLGWSAFVAYAAAVVLFVSVASGFNSEAKQTSRLVVKGSSLIFVGTYNGQYILKEFDPRTSTFDRESATLMPPDDLVGLERRKMRLKPSGRRQQDSLKPAVAVNSGAG